MKKLISFLILLFLGVITSACVNTFAIHELNERAVKFTQEGDYQKAISRLESAVDLDESVYETRYNLALAYIGNNECEKALESIEKAQSLLKEDDSSLLYSKGVTYDCLADKLINKKDEDGEEVKIIYKNAQEKLEAQNKYVDYLTKANESYEKYIELALEAKDKDAVEEAISKNKELIENIKNPQNTDDSADD